MLHYELSSPTGSNPESLIIVLHGLGDSIEGYRWLAPTLQLPWLRYALVNAPDDYFGGFSWYDFQGDVGSGVVRSRSLLFELLGHFETKGFAPENTFLFGFSQGCLMTWDVGIRYPKRLAGCIGISGYIHQSETLYQERSEAAMQQHFLVTHGLHDPLIPLSPVKEDVMKLATLGLQIQWQAFAKEHTIAGADEVDLIRDFIVKRRGAVPTR
tara:strand:- start:1083 stop:1718 length:636 start_codon:yes stop_codon:yes gene_type:complete